MHPPIYLKESALSFLRKEAKNIQRTTGRKHVEILNRIAAERGLGDWSGLNALREATKVEEAKIASSLIVMVEIDAIANIDGNLFIEHPDVPILCWMKLKPWLRASINQIGLAAEDEVLFDTLDHRYRYWRYVGDEKALPPTDEIEQWFQQYSLVGAALFMLRGEFIEPKLLRLPL
jgi:hypothetical protein